MSPPRWVDEAWSSATDAFRPRSRRVIWSTAAGSLTLATTKRWPYQVITFAEWVRALR